MEKALLMALIAGILYVVIGEIGTTLNDVFSSLNTTIGGTVLWKE